MKQTKRSGIFLALLLLLTLMGTGVRAEVTADDLDLARGKKAEASSQWNDGYAAGKTVDGDFDTRWSAAKGETANQWVQVDLGKTAEFDTVLTADYGLRTQKYLVEISNDGKVWEEVADGGTLGNQANQPHAISFDAVEARYVKLTIVEASSEPSLFVLQVYNSVEMADQNVSLPKPGVGTGSMAYTDINGKLTKDELESFVAYAQKKYQPAKDNLDNKMAYKDESAIDAMCMVYDITKDTRLLAPMLRGADGILYARNDQPGGDGRKVFTGKVEKCWPNKEIGAPNETYSGSENGNVLGHVAYVAECILNTPSVWEETVPDGDPKGYGKTYLERAKTYVAMCNETMQEFMIPVYIDPETKHERYTEEASRSTMTDPASYSSRAGYAFPWNQQWMINHGFIHLAKANELLQGDAEMIAEYKEIVQVSLDWFLEQLDVYEKDGHTVYSWPYWPKEKDNMNGGTKEDIGHMAFDIMGLFLALEYGYDTISEEHMKNIANTINYVIYDETQAPNVFAWKIDAMGNNERRSHLNECPIVLGIYDEKVYHTQNTSSAVGAATSNIARFGRTIYTKARMFGIEDGVVKQEQQPENNNNNPAGTGPVVKPPVEQNITIEFSDMQWHWAKDAVARAVSLGIVKGNADGTFRPDETLTRAEWTVMVARALQLKETRYLGVFGDVSAADWYAGFVQAALDAGLIAEDKSFRPNEPITREEMSKLAASAAVRLGTGKEIPEEFTLFYRDADAIGAWARESVRIVTYQEIMTGTDDGLFAPMRYATRAEAAAVMSRML